MNRLFLLSFENEADRRGHTAYFRSKVEIKYHNARNDGKI